MFSFCDRLKLPDSGESVIEVMFTPWLTSRNKTFTRVYAFASVLSPLRWADFSPVSTPPLLPPVPPTLSFPFKKKKKNLSFPAYKFLLSEAKLNCRKVIN